MLACDGKMDKPDPDVITAITAGIAGAEQHSLARHLVLSQPRRAKTVEARTTTTGRRTKADVSHEEDISDL
jgi:hypothetical protein